MDTGKKVALGVTLIFIAAIGIRVGLIYRERHEGDKAADKAPTYKVKDDDLVFLKKIRPSTLQDLKDLAGKPLWISAGGQLDYFPYANKKVDYTHSAGLLLGADRIDVKDAIQAVAPNAKTITFRIPAGDHHVLLVFTKPGGAGEYAVPVGNHDATGFNLNYVDDIFFYDDPHVLYKHWPADTWKAIDEHRVIKGMNERQAMLALGQVSSSGSTDYDNRTVEYDHQGHPVSVTFEHGHATNIREEKP
jgi:hypothetical protein